MNFIEYASSLLKFFQQFGECYQSGYIPINAKTPYIVYDIPYNSDMDSVILTIKVWDNSTKLDRLATITKQIEETIGRGITINTENGGLIIYTGNPFAQLYQPSEESPNYHAMVIQLEVKSI